MLPKFKPSYMKVDGSYVFAYFGFSTRDTAVEDFPTLDLYFAWLFSFLSSEIKREVIVFVKLALDKNCSITLGEYFTLSRSRDRNCDGWICAVHEEILCRTV